MNIYSGIDFYILNKYVYEDCIYAILCSFRAACIQLTKSGKFIKSVIHK